MSQKSKVSILLSQNAWKTILLDAYQRQEIEACGALLGRIDGEGNWHVEEVRPLQNIFASPVYFEFEPAELLTIELEQPGRMIGVYHSHPQGPAVASVIDRQNMQRVNSEQHIPWVWLIVSGPFSGTNQASISARGVVAYYHDQKAGLQKIAVLPSKDEGTEPF